MFLGSEYDDTCWNCEKNGHRQEKSFKPFNFRFIAARKSAFLENKQKSGNSSKRVLHEMIEGLQELMDLADSDDEDSTATAFFQDSSENIETNPSSEADVKDVGHALADFHADDDSDLDRDITGRNILTIWPTDHPPSTCI